MVDMIAHKGNVVYIVPDNNNQAVMILIPMELNLLKTTSLVNPTGCQEHP